MHTKWLAAFLLGVGCSLGGGAGLAQETAYEFKLKKPADTVSVAQEKDRAVFTIASESGIGGATIGLTKGAWPRRVAVRFVYSKDRGFTKLESFALTTATLHVSHAVAGAGEHKLQYWFAGPDGKFEPKDPGAGTLNVTAVLRNGALELTFPAHLCVGSREIKLAWIDAFRN